LSIFLGNKFSSFKTSIKSLVFVSMALAAYEDRFVIPTNHKEYSGDTPFDNEIAFSNKSSCGFTFGNGCSEGATTATLFGGNTHKNTMSGKVP
jgi:nitrate reductase beta subunit